MAGMVRHRTEAEAVERKAADLATLLRGLANARRLRILCRLIESGEMTVTTLADAVGLSQSALSQHLSKMRDEGIVACRREGQTIWYRIADRRIEQLYLALDALFCRAR